MKTFRALSGSIFLSLCFLTTWTCVSFAEESTSKETATTVEKEQIDREILIDLYIEFITSGGEDAYVITEIETERLHIRDLIETEIWTSIPTGEDEEIQELSELLDQQKKILSSLREKLRSTRVDLDLVQEEVEKFYRDGIFIVEVEDAVTRETYAEFLTNEILLKERIDILESIIPLQEERYEKLRVEQRKVLYSKLISILKYIGGFILLILLYKLIRRQFINRISNYHKRYALNKLLTTSVYTIVTVGVLILLFSKNPNILASLAIVGAGLAVALQDVVKDIVGWIIILEGKYKVGDRIVLNGVSGVVVDIGVLSTTLLQIGQPPLTGSVEQQTGKTFYIPNAYVLQFPILNSNTTSDFVKSEMKLVITLESNWKKAQEILEKILEEETRQYTEKDKVQYKYRTAGFYVSSSSKGPEVFMDIADYGIRFSLRFDRPLGKKRNVIQAVTEKILTEFEKEPDIILAYNTFRIFSENS